jgi:hypothetical protein
LTLTIAPGAVAQRVLLLERVKAAGTGAALDAHAALAEQPAQDLGHLEDLHALVLVDEIELGRGVQLARHHGVVEVGHEPRPGDLAERRRTLAAQPQEVGEGVAVVAGGPAAQGPEAALELGRDAAPLLGRQAVQLLARETLPEALDRLERIVRHGAISLAGAGAAAGLRRRSCRPWPARAAGLAA